MKELIAVGLSVVLWSAALVKAGASSLTWWLFRLPMSRLLTATLALLIGFALLRLAGGDGPQ